MRLSIQAKRFLFLPKLSANLDQNNTFQNGGCLAVHSCIGFIGLIEDLFSFLVVFGGEDLIDHCNWLTSLLE